MDSNMKKMIGYAVGATGLAIVDLTGIAVVNGYKDNGSIDNATADLFIMAPRFALTVVAPTPLRASFAPSMIKI